MELETLTKNLQYVKSLTEEAQNSLKNITDMLSDEDAIMDTKDLAHFFKCSEESVRALAKHKDFPLCEVGAGIKVYKYNLAMFLAKNPRILKETYVR